jgi:CheY-like chemotaxis protein
MITAHDTQSDRQKAQLKGADLFIGKPFTRDTILGTLESLFVNKPTPQL